MEVIKDHNVNTLNLLRNKDFVFINNRDTRITFKVPTFEDYITDNNLSTFLSLLEINKDQFDGIDITSNLKLLLVLLQNNLYSLEILYVLNKYIPDFKAGANNLFVGKEALTSVELDFIISTWKVSLGSKAVEDLKIEKEEEIDEFEKLIKEKEAKVRKIKSKAENGNLDMERVVATVMKEFNFKMDDLLPMNMFTIFWYYRYAIKYSYYRIETIAAGNGLLKKHKHFSE
jgi:hypothetical protein